MADINTPYELCEGAYERIELRMKARSFLEESDFVVLGHESPEYPSGDMSLTRQLKSALACEKTSTEPQAYLFTALSAIPTADALRGNFNERGAILPLLGYIAANRQSALHNHDPSALSSVNLDKFRQQQETEISRLATLYSGLSHVCVVDQYVRSGNTLMYAEHLLACAGIQQISAIRGRWYCQATPSEVDIPNLTSAHADFMHRVGRQSCS